ncbi:MAG: hypothetical protein AABY64_06935 [Bdellovibrionota bacterium]
MKNLIVLFVLFLLAACAGSPQKDIYFRMRPPTSEVPTFHKSNGFGFKMQAETQRFTVNPTKNLVNNFNFDNNLLYATDSENTILGLAGLDLSLLYTRYIYDIPFELSIAPDFAKT